LRRCAAPWMALPKPYRDVFTGVLLNGSCNLQRSESATLTIPRLS